MQVDRIEPTLKALAVKSLKLQYDALLSLFAFNFNVRRYTLAWLPPRPPPAPPTTWVERCRLTLSNTR